MMWGRRKEDASWTGEGGEYLDDLHTQGKTIIELSL